MRASGSALLFAFTVTLCWSDERKVTRTTAPHFEAVTTEYVQGNNRRRETMEKRSDRGVSHIAEILLERGLVYQLDLNARQYVELHIPTFPAARPAPTRRFGTTVDIYFETTDTGETKEFFGRQARHLILRQREVVEPGSCRKGHVFEKDGWYFPKPENTLQVVDQWVSNFDYVLGGKRCLGQMVYHGHQAAVVVVKETFGPIEKELLEFSTEPLDRSLFAPPSGFEKVAALSGPTPLTWSDELEFQWADLVRGLESWFRGLPL